MSTDLVLTPHSFYFFPLCVCVSWQNWEAPGQSEGLASLKADHVNGEWSVQGHWQWRCRCWEWCQGKGSRPPPVLSCPWLVVPCRPSSSDVLVVQPPLSSWCAGNLMFDPLGFKPTDPAAFKTIATKEINNGRLAMLAVAGIVAQELVTGEKIF